MLDYQPMTEEEIDRIGLLEGKFRFRVMEATDTISKSSRLPQIELKLRIFVDDGSNRTITTYLSTNGQFMLRRLRHFCRATNLMTEYEARRMCADTCLNVEGIVELAIEKGQPMNDGSNRNYPDKIAVVDFIENNSSVNFSTKQATNDFVDDKDIPF